MSNHTCEVVPVVLVPHPNADNLRLVHVKGWIVVVRTEEWQGVSRGIYIPPDSVVPDTPEWSWLENRRIRARKFRGVVSYGLLVPAPADAIVGMDYADRLGITHYEPPLELSTYGE